MPARYLNSAQAATIALLVRAARSIPDTAYRLFATLWAVNARMESGGADYRAAQLKFRASTNNDLAREVEKIALSGRIRHLAMLDAERIDEDRVVRQRVWELNEESNRLSKYGPAARLRYECKELQRRARNEYLDLLSGRTASEMRGEDSALENRVKQIFRTVARDKGSIAERYLPNEAKFYTMPEQVHQGRAGVDLACTVLDPNWRERADARTGAIQPTVRDAIYRRLRVFFARPYHTPAEALSAGSTFEDPAGRSMAALSGTGTGSS